MSASSLSIDVYVAPMRPYNCPDQPGEGEVATWAPSGSTLISGPTEGILIDALLTFENADQIAAWAKSFRAAQLVQDRGEREEMAAGRRCSGQDWGHQEATAIGRSSSMSASSTWRRLSRASRRSNFHM
jgi:hypothetical protein